MLLGPHEGVRPVSFSEQSLIIYSAGCPGKFIDLSDPQVLGTAVTDVNGKPDLTFLTPTSAAGKTASLQAVDFYVGQISNHGLPQFDTLP